MIKEKLQRMFFFTGFRDYFFVFIILIALVLRVQEFTPLSDPHYIEDASRDYLIGHHILAYHEFPLNGPLGQLPNSPFYYYFIAAVLLIHDGFLFLNYFNVALQILFIWGVYILSRNLFGTTSGRIAALLVAVSPLVVRQSLYIWMPYVMQVFLIISFVLLSYAYKIKSYKLLCEGAVLFIVSGLIYHPAFALSPALVAVIILTFVRMRGSLKYTCTRMALLFLLILNISLLAYLRLFLARSIDIYGPLSYYGFLSHAPSLFGASFNNSIHNGGERVLIFLQSLFFRLQGRSLIAICSLLIGCIAVYGYRVPKGSKEKKYMFFLGACTAQFFLIIPWIHMSYVSFPFRYFTPIIGIFFIIVAETIRGIFSDNSLYHNAQMIIATGFIVATVADSNALILTLSDFQKTPVSGHISAAVMALDNNTHEKTSLPVFEAVIKNIKEVQEREHRSQPNFFQFDSYINGSRYTLLEPIFWALLEENLKVKLVAVDDNDARGFHPLATDDYIFLICNYTEEQQETYQECLNGFFAHKPGYNIEKSVYRGSPYSVFLAKKY